MAHIIVILEYPETIDSIPQEGLSTMYQVHMRSTGQKVCPSGTETILRARLLGVEEEG